MLDKPYSIFEIDEHLLIFHKSHMKTATITSKFYLKKNDHLIKDYLLKDYE